MTSMIALVPMTPSEYETYISVAIPAYAKEKAAAGQWSEAESLNLASQSFCELLPQGLGTPNHYLFTIRDAKTRRLGVLWVAVQKRADTRIAYVFEIYIDPKHRRRGHATGALLALVDKANDMQFSGIALHVFGHNAGAQSLYEKLGFVVTGTTMFKSLDPQ